jgi:hypothetical protein
LVVGEEWQQRLHERLRWADALDADPGHRLPAAFAELALAIYGSTNGGR